MEETPYIYSLSETSVTVNLGNSVSPTVQARVQQLLTNLNHEPFPGYQESVPSYIGLTVFYDPMKVETAAGSVATEVKAILKERVNQLGNQAIEQSGNRVTIPVCYDIEYGPDLNDVATKNGLSKEEVIQIHTSGDYLVYMIGFAPGFPFLGGMDERIATPRHAQPRTEIPAGSVGIAGSQTGVYPISTPGGWQLIGQTPLTLFSASREVPSLLRAGDHVTFKQITKEEFLQMKEGEQ
ncbi:5-oxoprolinase subunit PxpB [Shouchella lehensis]|uniref:5-oxoprolinase subunit PxpB n=1 Tax=Shouchella lehensis TaxID=300825 RepID=A0A4Y7WL25_9BACI|nr:5-oxoprolinase subunit PxpB [Shouchella lehensis]MBG9783371.1 kinase inhibitor [Shouchella lehensis]RQW22426.1 5-oxoprolinase subunit PxpB [Bacillus sp. C1-1]TES49243.1 5-oxoprolinase subunit PxpB [Shouchella lehensis]